MLFNINTLKWDEDILKELNIPTLYAAGSTSPSSCVYGETASTYFGGAIPIAGAAGDQQAALFGQTCFDAGRSEKYIRNRLLPADEHRRKAGFFRHTVLLPRLHGASADKITYALEGSIFVGGAAIQWLRDEIEADRFLGGFRVYGAVR